MIAVPQAYRSQKTSCDYLLQGHKAEYLILVPSKYRMRLRRDSMPMAKEVKAAAITAIGGCIAAVLTGLVTHGCNQTQIEKLKEQRTKITDPAGVYLWQTVVTLNGERWKGYIQVDSQGNPTIQMWKVEDCPGNHNLELRLLQQEPGHAEVTIRQPGRLHIQIPVRFLKYDKHCELPTPDQPLGSQEVLEGDIDQTAGYVGQIKYIKSSGEEPLGGMILVKDIPGSGLH